MFNALLLGTAAVIAFGGGAVAHPVGVPEMPDPLRPLLVKHDKDDNGHGRKLGHYKHPGDDDEDEDEDRGRRRSSRRGAYAPWANPAPYYWAPGYGSSYPPPAYGYPPPPYYYPGGY